MGLIVFLQKMPQLLNVMKNASSICSLIDLYLYFKPINFDHQFSSITTKSGKFIKLSLSLYKIKSIFLIWFVEILCSIIYLILEQTIN